MDNVGAFAQYQIAHEHAGWMMAEYNSASRGLTLAQIMERAAECKSQSEPLNAFLTKYAIPAVREAMRVDVLALIAYVAYGHKIGD